MSNFPWEHVMWSEMYCSSKYNTSYKRTYTTIPDNKNLVVRKGDIFQLTKGILKQPHDWREWFLPKQEVEKYIVFNKDIPVYCRGQWAIVLNRYKYIKHKWANIYRDYGAEVLFLTGSKRGKIKRFYKSIPWIRYISFDVITCANKKNIDFNIFKTDECHPFRVKNDELYYAKLNINKFIRKHKIKRDNEQSIDLLVQKIYNLARGS